MSDTYRVRFDWSLMSGAERASQTFHFLGPDTALTTLMSGLIGAVNTAWPAIDQDYNNGTILTRLVGSRLQDTTPWHALETTEAVMNLAGTAATSPLPPQCAVVASLRTASASRRARGRVYLPAPISTLITPIGKVAGTHTQNAVDFVGAILQAVNNLAAPEWSSIVFSKTAGGGHTPITLVKVGDVFDTQRRRRDALIEAHKLYGITP